MTVASLRPATAHGRVAAPPSKSYTHRLLLAAHLSGRSSRVLHPLVSDDTLTTARALRRLGSAVRLGRSVWSVAPGDPPRAGRPVVIDCGESGTTLRLLTAAAALQGGRFRFRGAGRLPRRPMRPLLDALRSLGAEVVEARPPSVLPMDVQGPIHGGPVRLPVGESSQFTSALLFALPTVRPASFVRTVGEPVSEPYVRASVAVLTAHGIRIVAGHGGYRIAGGQSYRPVDEAVPGDASSAAYLWSAAAITGGAVIVDGVPSELPQADLAVLDLLRRYGASVRRRGAAVSVVGDRRRPFRIRLTDAPDLFPLAGVLAGAALGQSELLGAAHVAAKESDRKRETARLVRAMGGRVVVGSDRVGISGVARPRALRLRGLLDHRLVMSAAVAAAAADGPSSIGDAAAVRKSFPGFFETFARLGVEARVA